jgi:hypothetical protein
MNELILCASCARHVRLHEPQCPFCRASLTPVVQQRPKALAIPRGLSRSKLRALHVAALATGVAAAACGAGESSPGSLGSSDAAERDGESRDVASGDVVAFDVGVTDASTILEATVESGIRDATDDFMLRTLYGGPAVDDDIV